MTAQYEKDGTTGQYGANYYTSTETCNVYPAGGILAVKLDAAHSKTLNAVALQNRGTAGAITIKAAYFASEAEYAEAKAAADKIEKTVDIDATGGSHELKAKDWGWDSKWLDKDVSAFNTLVLKLHLLKVMVRLLFREHLLLMVPKQNLIRICLLLPKLRLIW